MKLSRKSRELVNKFEAAAAAYAFIGAADAESHEEIEESYMIAKQKLNHHIWQLEQQCISSSTSKKKLRGGSTAKPK